MRVGHSEQLRVLGGWFSLWADDRLLPEEKTFPIARDAAARDGSIDGLVDSPVDQGAGSCPSEDPRDLLDNLAALGCADVTHQEFDGERDLVDVDVFGLAETRCWPGVRTRSTVRLGWSTKSPSRMTGACAMARSMLRRMLAPTRPMSHQPRIRSWISSTCTGPSVSTSAVMRLDHVEVVA